MVRLFRLIFCMTQMITMRNSATAKATPRYVYSFLEEDDIVFYHSVSKNEHATTQTQLKFCCPVRAAGVTGLC